MREIYFSKPVEKFLEKLQKSDKKLAQQLGLEMNLLRKNPNHSSTKKLVKLKGLYRSRVGKYRIIYEFDDKNLFILLIAKRDEVYQLLAKN